jgi:hypothetical protein
LIGRAPRRTLAAVIACTSLQTLHSQAHAAVPAEPAPALDVTDSARAERIRVATLARYANRAETRRFSGPSTTVRTPRFIFAKDDQLTLPTPPWFDDSAYADAFELARSSFYQTQSDRVRLIMVFSTFKDGGKALFYLPLANDIQGLGEGQPASIFDNTPSSMLDGYAWLGNLGALETAGDSYVSEAFVHEIAHRWGAYVHISNPLYPQDILLGRQNMHWSFLVDSKGSPMEGNAWTDQGSHMFVTSFGNPPDLAFSPLDLYLMGVLPPSAVPPFQVITSWSVVQPSDMNVTKETPPAHRTGVPVTLDALQTASITIEDVIAGNGPRVPAASAGPVVWPIGIVLLSSGFEQPPLDDLTHLADRLESLINDFNRATGGRITLDVHVEGAGTSQPGAYCSTLDDCDRARSDRCVSVRANQSTVCARGCSMDAPCPSGSCCDLAGDQATHVCIASQERCTALMTAISSTETAASMPKEPTRPPPGSAPATLPSRGCACASAMDSSSARGWAPPTSIPLIWALRRRKRTRL